MFLISSFEENILNVLHHFGEDREKAEMAFTATLKEKMTSVEWDDLSSADVESILDDGFASYGCGVVNFIDTDGWEDMDILDGIDANFGKK